LENSYSLRYSETLILTEYSWRLWPLGPFASGGSAWWAKTPLPVGILSGCRPVDSASKGGRGGGPKGPLWFLIFPWGGTDLPPISKSPTPAPRNPQASLLQGAARQWPGPKRRAGFLGWVLFPEQGREIQPRLSRKATETRLSTYQTFPALSRWPRSTTALVKGEGPPGLKSLPESGPGVFDREPRPGLVYPRVGHRTNLYEGFLGPAPPGARAPPAGTYPTKLERRPISWPAIRPAKKCWPSPIHATGGFWVVNISGPSENGTGRPKFRRGRNPLCPLPLLPSALISVPPARRAQNHSCGFPRPWGKGGAAPGPRSKGHHGPAVPRRASNRSLLSGSRYIASEFLFSPLVAGRAQPGGLGGGPRHHFFLLTSASAGRQGDAHAPIQIAPGPGRVDREKDRLSCSPWLPCRPGDDSLNLPGDGTLPASPAGKTTKSHLSKKPWGPGSKGAAWRGDPFPLWPTPAEVRGRNGQALGGPKAGPIVGPVQGPPHQGPFRNSLGRGGFGTTYWNFRILSAPPGPDSKTRLASKPLIENPGPRATKQRPGFITANVF